MFWKNSEASKEAISVASCIKNLMKLYFQQNLHINKVNQSKLAQDFVRNNFPFFCSALQLQGRLSDFFFQTESYRSANTI